MSRSPAARQISAVKEQAERDIEPVSARLARSIFERRGVAENRLLMRTLGTSPRELQEFSLLWNTCLKDHTDIQNCLMGVLNTVKEASNPNRGEDTYLHHWWAAWVSSPAAACHADTPGRMHLPGEEQAPGYRMSVKWDGSFPKFPLLHGER